MTETFEFHAGTTPLLISIPHDGRIVPAAIAKRMTAAARKLPDTDWHVRRLYEFSNALGASVIAATHSRYVVDLNRSPADEALYDGRFVTGLCPLQMFDGEAIYLRGRDIDAGEKARRIETYWRPYHDRIASFLQDAKRRFGYALLFDAHSIRSRVPLLFDGELSALNIGTHGGRSCAGTIIKSVTNVTPTGGDYTVALDGRFKGGYITRHYGDPASGVHAIQLELAQKYYMDEASWEFDRASASQLQRVLSRILKTFMASAAEQ